MRKNTLKLIAVVAFCLGVIFVPTLALIVGGVMLAFAIVATIWAHWMAWKPGSKTEDPGLPDQDIYHQPRGMHCMNPADQVRDYAYRSYVMPARAKKSLTVSFSAGPIHKALRFHNLMPCVCGAIDTNKFETQYEVKKVARTGPKHGATAHWIFFDLACPCFASLCGGFTLSTLDDHFERGDVWDRLGFVILFTNLSRLLRGRQPRLPDWHQAPPEHAAVVSPVQPRPRRGFQ